PTLIKLLNHYYIWFHFPAAIGLLLWLFVRHPERYAAFRNLMTFATFAALAIHLVFPLAPPRMISGFVDTMRVFGPSIYPASALEGAANQIAAMPSLHFGWALIEAVAVVSVLRSRWRWLIVIHPVVMTLAIIATANHWWVDAAAAGLLVLVAVTVGRWIRRTEHGLLHPTPPTAVPDGDLVDVR
ncbi:MAG: phosphatase PAP2 family protein, partial [Ilumatobacteraceae bacterium]